MTAVVSATPLAPIAAKENFLQRFGDWIEGLFSHAETAYQELEDEAKKAAVWGSGIIAILNNTLGKTPDEIKQLFQAKFPELSFDVIQGFLDQLQQKFDQTASNPALSFDEAIQWAQGWLQAHKSSDDNAWGIISSAASNFLSVLFSPGTAIEKFISLGVYVYHMIVKPHVETPLPAATTGADAGPVDTNPEGSPDSVGGQAQMTQLPDGSTVAVGSDEFNAAVEAEVQKRIANQAQQAAPPAQA